MLDGLPRALGPDAREHRPAARRELDEHARVSAAARQRSASAVSDTMPVPSPSAPCGERPVDLALERGGVDLVVVENGVWTIGSTP